MRLALLLAIGLVLGGVAVATVPAASACSSDPDSICILIGKVECTQEEGLKYAAKTCWGLP